MYWKIIKINLTLFIIFFVWALFEGGLGWSPNKMSGILNSLSSLFLYFGLVTASIRFSISKRILVRIIGYILLAVLLTPLIIFIYMSFSDINYFKEFFLGGYLF